jgi:histidinol-phosphate aminotransferase
MRTDVDEHALRHHGDRDTGSGLVDLAVNVRSSAPPDWLRRRLVDQIARLGDYPDATDATAAVARRHRRDPTEVLVTHGAAEAFVLLARALRPRRPVVVHPQFTEPEAALRDAGCRVDRVVLPPPFDLADAVVPEDADMVVVGNPTNPTSRLHDADLVRALARPGRTLVVDEAFMDTVPGEPESLAADRGLPGLVVVRSLTKQFSLAGLRAGYLLAAAETVEALQVGRPLWPVSSLALTATEACVDDHAVARCRRWAQQTQARRAHLLARLGGLPAVHAVEPAAASFLLLRVEDGASVRDRLRARGLAVRRCDTFPGLGPDWLRVAVRDVATSTQFVHALAESLPHDTSRPPRNGEAGQCW